MSGPLAGVRVIDLSTVIAGPMATQVLADQGADVVKIEAPGVGDLCRYLGPARGGVSAMFVSVNRNKRSVALNLKSAQGRSVLLDLVRGADVFVENMREGAIERLGLTYDALKAVQPDLIYVSMSGFGDKGPYKDRRVYDPVIQAVSGFCDSQRDRETGHPQLIQSVVCDKVTALTAAQAITAALFAKARGRGGQLLRLNMLDSALAFLWPDAYWAHTFIGDGASSAIDLSEIYMIRRTQDGYIATIAISDDEFRALTRALDAPQLGVDPRFATMGARLQNSVALRDLLAPLFAQRTSADVSGRFVAEDVPHAVVNNRGDALSDPQILNNQILVEVQDPALGRVRQVRPAAQFATTPADLRSLAPMLGQNTIEVLAEIGRSPGDIDALKAVGAI